MWHWTNMGWYYRLVAVFFFFFFFFFDLAFQHFLNNHHYNCFVDGLIKLYKHEGIKGCYRVSFLQVFVLCNLYLSSVVKMFSWLPLSLLIYVHLCWIYVYSEIKWLYLRIKPLKRSGIVENMRSFAWLGTIFKIKKRKKQLWEIFTLNSNNCTKKH